MSTPIPYNTFGRYNKNEKVEESYVEQNNDKPPSVANPYGSTKGIRPMQTVSIPSGGIKTSPSYTGGQVPNPQPQQQPPVQVQAQAEERKTRFKKVSSSQEMYKIITEGHKNFQESFKSRNMQAPPMKIFLKIYTEWCEPCKKITPVLDELSTLQAFSGVIFLEFNADQMKGDDPFSKRLENMFQMSAIPVFFTFIDGQITGKQFSAERQGVLTLAEKLLQ